MASVLYREKPLNPDDVVDETWFSDSAFCESRKLWYPVSKILAEEAAWRFAKENGIDLVTIHPGVVIGPLLQPTLSTSMEVFAQYAKGAQTYLYDNWYLVDVRDVANAHIEAFELASARGRYCLVETVVHFSEFLKIVHKHYPTPHIPEKCQDDKSFVPKHEVSKEKAKALGIDFIPLELSVVDTIESLKEKGFLNV
ncbi:phenylacetaldehyde reductase-like [Hevea brasiliensis]|uniref:phenylacetaldehyde reductase-like n=1 Tax=Hevea brasiliensis TaxID=3981 RepID=UPI0025F8B168|nr:phenylacetaldehyde reductase-like [Hevea brasiliensis]